jgi:hypothetical protein
MISAKLLNGFPESAAFVTESPPSSQEFEPAASGRFMGMGNG